MIFPRTIGASFRNKDEITELCGCDRLTISPALLDQLKESTEPLVKKLDASKAATMADIEKIAMDEKTFRWMLNDSAMATEKLAEGIRNFAKDIVSLEAIVKEKM